MGGLSSLLRIVWHCLVSHTFFRTVPWIVIGVGTGCLPKISRRTGGELSMHVDVHVRDESLRYKCYLSPIPASCRSMFYGTMSADVNPEFFKLSSSNSGNGWVSRLPSVSWTLDWHPVRSTRLGGAATTGSDAVSEEAIVEIFRHVHHSSMSLLSCQKPDRFTSDAFQHEAPLSTPTHLVLAIIGGRARCTTPIYQMFCFLAPLSSL